MQGRNAAQINYKREFLIILRGIRNGFYYGAKVRFMHSIVMAILFPRKDYKSEIIRVLKLTFKHASKLAIFIGIYKSLLLLMKILSKEKK